MKAAEDTHEDKHDDTHEDTHEDLTLIFRSIAAQVIEKPLPDVPLATPIAELGIDSVLVAEIVARLEDQLGIEIPADQWLRVRTLKDLVDAVGAAKRHAKSA
jgi:acyl carrier protein